MSFPALVALLVSLPLCFVPVWLLRRSASAGAQDYFVSAESTAPGIIQNSSIAYALKMATFGPFFVLGASGDFWPAIVGSAALGLGLYLLRTVRRPIIDFVRSSLERDQSVTVHAFIAQRHGNDCRIRLLAAGLTLLALFGLMMCEALGVAALLTPLIPEATHTLIFCIVLALAALYALPSGNSGVLRATQTQLGILYLGLFGSTALLLYIVMATLRRMSPQCTFAVIFVALGCIAMLGYRRSRYVDTSPIQAGAPEPTPGAEGRREPRSARLFKRFIKILNVCVSVLAVFVIVFAGMQLYFRGLPTTLSDGAAALQIGPQTSALAFVALASLLMFYPVVDVTNWQRIAVLAKGSDANPAASDALAAAYAAIMRVYAIETAIVSLFFCMFGALAVAALRIPASADAMQDFIAQLSSQQNWVSAGASSLIILALVMIALSTMGALFSAGLCVLHYDILPALQAVPARAGALPRARGRAQTVLAGAGLCVLVAIAILLAQAGLKIDFPGDRFLALILALCCAQLSFAPLVFGAVIGAKAGRVDCVSPAWALAIIGFSAAVGMGAAAAYLVIGNELLLWAAVPACLGSGFLIYAIARLKPPKASYAC